MNNNDYFPSCFVFVFVCACVCMHYKHRYEDKGAFTSAVSVDMLKSVGCEYVLVGHSERRLVFGETDEEFNKMVKKVLTAFNHLPYLTGR